ncbi:MAG: caspase domain-containing protein, partial [Flavobacteriales bacterium]
RELESQLLNLGERIVSGELDTRPYCLKPTPDGGWVMAGESCTKYNFDGKPVKCKSAVIKIMGTPSAGVQHYIALKVKAWEKRGEFEKSADYNQRVSEANRKKVIEKHRQEAISYYAAQAIDVDRSTLSNYDADKELFSIRISGVGAVPVAVQIEDAQPFKSSWQSKSYTFERASFDLSGDHFILKGLDLVINGKVYSYNTEKAPGKFVYTETREHNAGTSLYRGGGDPLKGLNLSNAKEMPNGKYFALIIGVDNYKGQWRSLNNAVRDAQAIELLLKKKYRFNQFTTLYDEQATRENIINAFYRLVENAKENDNVFIYYSGHGEFDKKLNKGYWVPVDAQTQSVSAYISNSDIQTFLNGIKAKHTLLVSDACFSGDIFRGNTISVPFEESEKYYKEVSRLASRQAITSGGIEPVMDGGKDGHSVFAYYFIKALNTNDKTYLDAAQLFNAIKIPVVNNSEQTPKMQPVKNTGDEGGQFLFIRK